jgi:hypothetical protein
MRRVHFILQEQVLWISCISLCGFPVLSDSSLIRYIKVQPATKSLPTELFPSSSIVFMETAAQKTMYIECAKYAPGKRSNHKQNPDPVRHRPMCKNQAAMTLDDRRDDAVLVGVFVSWSRSFDRAERIVTGGAAYGHNASV